MLVIFTLSLKLIDHYCNVEKMSSKVNIWSAFRYGSIYVNRHVSSCCAMILCGFGQSRNIFGETHSIHSAALLQAMLQRNTEQFRKILVETSNRAVEMWNG